MSLPCRIVRRGWRDGCRWWYQGSGQSVFGDMRGMGILRRLAGVRSGMASVEASCNGVTWCYRGNRLFFLLLGVRCNVTRRVVTLFALV